MLDDPLLKVPFTQRRGCWLEDRGSSWEAVLLKGDADLVAEKLEAVDSIGLVKRDVTSQVLNGACPVPDGKWALLVKLTNSDWLHLADPAYLNPFTRDLQIAERLAAESGLKVLQTGYQKTAAATYVQVHAEREEALFFESTGSGFNDAPLADGAVSSGDDASDERDDLDATTLKSQHYPAGWWKRFEDEGQVQQAILRDLQAYVPFLQAYPDGDTIGLTACHEDAVLPEHVERIDLIVFGSGASANPNPANQRLADSIESGDLSELESALADGADLSALPGITSPPLVYAIQKFQADDPNGMEIITALISAGAAVDAPELSQCSPLSEAIRASKESPDQASELVNALLDAGADINRQTRATIFGGGTPAHEAVRAQLLSLVMLLHSRGADLAVRDTFDRTPLDYVNATRQPTNPFAQVELAEGTETAHRSIAEYLTQAASGGPAGDWRSQLQRDQERIRSEQETLQALSENLKLQMKNAFGISSDTENDET